MKKKCFLISGASSGIGEEFAKAYAAIGHDLILVARRLNKLEELKKELEDKYGVKVTPISCDLSQRNAVNDMVKTIKSKDIIIDGLINNAGFSVARTFVKTTIEEQLNFIEVCVIAPSILCREFLPQMLERGFGRIINVSSMVAFSNGAAGHTLYPAAKSFILKMSRSLSAETKGSGVYITALCPGSTQSEFQTANGMNDKIGQDNIVAPMAVKDVVAAAIRANEAGREFVITGFVNKFAVWAMKYIPEFILNPIIRNGAKKFLIE